MTFFRLALIAGMVIPAAGWSVSYLHINGELQATLTCSPFRIILTSDISAGCEKQAVETFLDVNNNGKLDAADRLMDFLRLRDGIGWIRDPESRQNDIPGDEEAMDGCLQLTFNWAADEIPTSHQQWILRATDEDNSAALALLRWQMPITTPLLNGSVVDAGTGRPVMQRIIRAENHDISKSCTAVCDENGRFALGLTPGTWQVFAEQLPDVHYQSSDTLSLSVTSNEVKEIRLSLRPYTSFLEGTVRFENNRPAAGLVLAVQNLDDFSCQFAETNARGHFSLGVSNGNLCVLLKPVFSELSGKKEWPDGYYAEPECDTLCLFTATTVTRNLTLRKYPATITGICQTDGKAAKGVLIQAIANDNAGNSPRLCQSYTKSDGSYILGIPTGLLTLLTAEKEGFSVSPAIGYSNLTIAPGTILANLNFQLAHQPAVMSISGTVLQEDFSPSLDIEVIAFNDQEDSPKGHLFTRTNAKGEYRFDIEAVGGWQVGIYKKNCSSSPAMRYLYLSPGTRYTEQNFCFSQEKLATAFNNGEIQPTDFRLIPRPRNPFGPQTVIQFVLPSKQPTRVEVLSAVGRQVNTLLNQVLSSGVHSLIWEGKDQTGRDVASGVYLCRVTAGNESAVQTITLLR
jgi:hypothetical protein